MDETRWDTGQLLAAGVLNRDVPQFGEPEGREDFGYDVYDDTRQQLVEKVESGCVARCSEYYGIPIGWKDDDGSYRGVLLQYRNVTEDHTFATVEELADWFVETASAVAG